MYKNIEIPLASKAHSKMDRNFERTVFKRPYWAFAIYSGFIVRSIRKNKMFRKSIMTYYHFRFTYPNEDAMKRVAMWLASNSTVTVLCFERGHTTEKRHFHALIQPIKTLTTFRQNFNKHFSVDGKQLYSGNEHYSCSTLRKPLDGTVQDRVDHNCRYILKGEGIGDFEYFIGNLTHEQCHQYNREYWEQNAKQKEESLNKRVSGVSFLQKTHARILDTYPEEVAFIRDYQHNEFDDPEIYHKPCRILFDFFMTSLGKAVKSLDTRQVEFMFKGIINSIRQESKHAKKNNDKLYNRIYNIY